MQQLVGVSATGKRCQQWHGRAKLTMSDIDLIMALHDEHGLSYRVLAEKFEVSKSAIAAIMHGRNWTTTVIAWRRPSRGANPK